MDARLLMPLLLRLVAARPSQDVSAEFESYPLEERICFETGQVPFDGKCYRLLEPGPCDADSGEWLVLAEGRDASGRLRFECRECHCCDAPLLVWMNGTCRHQVHDRAKLCPLPGTELVNDAFGEGACRCKPGFAPWKDVGCFQLFRRGPCPEKQVLLEESRCGPDPCSELNAQSGGTASLFARWDDGDGRCYALGSQGPCGADAVFRVHKWTQRTGCVNSLDTLNLVEPGCLAPDATGKCHKPVVTHTSQAFYLQMVLAQNKPRKTRKTRRHRS